MMKQQTKSCLSGMSLVLITLAGFSLFVSTPMPTQAQIGNVSSQVACMATKYWGRSIQKNNAGHSITQKLRSRGKYWG